ncbi:hypothetical protein B296_00049477 [Ensete ventricosum]|uniref:Uncharacterized protein n=1 Tax=Ensete ventricosum TaxID=4639 RepID=A0A426YAF0_ENSVE|nr:hypothetical protein B296_00049477 [Ensete ventricosum]
MGGASRRTADLTQIRSAPPNCKRLIARTTSMVKKYDSMVSHKSEGSRREPTRPDLLAGVDGRPELEYSLLTRTPSLQQSTSQAELRITTHLDELPLCTKKTTSELTLTGLNQQMLAHQNSEAEHIY